jgi:hypothetical protein
VDIHAFSMIFLKQFCDYLSTSLNLKKIYTLYRLLIQKWRRKILRKNEYYTQLIHQKSYKAYIFSVRMVISSWSFSFSFNSLEIFSKA